MKNSLAILLVLMGLTRLAVAQDFAYGNVSTEDLNMKKYAKDTSAHAVVLQEYGNARINTVGTAEIKLIFEYHVKIKIFDNKGFGEATKEIRLRTGDDNPPLEEVENIRGTTYNMDDKGLIQQTEFDPKKVYIARDYKQQSTLKFTMPGLTNGCIIEFKYTVLSSIYVRLDHFHPWYFQSDIPKEYSEYEAVIPAQFTYNAVLHGFLKLTKNSTAVESECFSFHGARADCSDIKYGMSDIPAFVEEDYMTSRRNYLSSISFDLVELVNPYSGMKVKGTKEWKDLDYSLKSEQFFGGQLKKKDAFKDRMVPVIAGKTGDLEKARAIYAYLQHWYKWNNYIGIYASDNVKKTYEAHSGSIGDINISLIDALNGAGINTEAVMLSTRDNGFVNEVYPAISDFNYVIAKANIGDKSYYLDATDPLLGFGILPLKCLGGRGRVFDLDKPSYWVTLDLPQKGSSSRSIDLTLEDDGKLTGTITNYFMGYEAYKKRVAIKKFNTVDEYVEDLYSKSSKVKVLKSDISNVDSLNSTLTEKFDVEINIFDKLNLDKLSFNPFFLTRITENPFKLAERLYPVDMGVPLDDRVVLTVKLPAQYTVDSPPQNIAIALPNSGGKFLTDYQANDNTFTFSHVIQFSKSVYAPEEYPYLKELYNKIIQSEKAEMIFKKK